MRSLIYFIYIFLAVQIFGAQQTINIGLTANDGTGDTLRAAFVKVNENFTDLYSQTIDLQGIINLGNQGSITNAVAIGSSAYYIGSSNIVNVINDAASGAGGDLSGVNDYLGTGTITNLAAMGMIGNGYIGGNLTVATNVTVGGQVLAPSASGFSFSDYTNGTITKGVRDGLHAIPIRIAAMDALVVKQGGAAVAGTLSFGPNSGTLVSDTYLLRDAAGTLALRNGTASNVFRTYGTYTDASNYERVSLSHNKAGTAVLAAETAGTGTDDQSLKIQLAGNGALYVDGDLAGNARGNNAVDLQIYRTLAQYVASGAYSGVIGGFNNRATATYSVALGGYSNTSSGQRSLTYGYESTASASDSVAIGHSANGYLHGQRAYSSGRFSAVGDAQGSRLVARNTTTGSSADLFLDGVDDRLVLPANTSWKFTVEVTGRGTDAGAGAEEVASYEFKGTITRDGANNTSFPWPVTKTVEGESDATWDVTVSADDTNEALNISCTGGSGDNVRWVAIINLVEVGG